MTNDGQITLSDTRVQKIRYWGRVDFVMAAFSLLVSVVMLIAFVYTSIHNNDGVNLSNTLTFVGMPTVNGIVMICVGLFANKLYKDRAQATLSYLLLSAIAGMISSLISTGFTLAALFVITIVSAMCQHGTNCRQFILAIIAALVIMLVACVFQLFLHIRVCVLAGSCCSNKRSEDNNGAVITRMDDKV